MDVTTSKNKSSLLIVNLLLIIIMIGQHKLILKLLIIENQNMKSIKNILSQLFI